VLHWTDVGLHVPPQAPPAQTNGQAVPLSVQAPALEQTCD